MEKPGKNIKRWLRMAFLAPLLSSRSFLLIAVLVPMMLIVLNKSGTFSWKCPFFFLTGLYCPGCGMTRGGISLLQGDFAMAFSYHPFSWLFAGAWFFFLILMFLPKATLYTISAKFAKIEEKFPIIPLLFILFVFFGLARLIFQIYD